MRNLYRAYNGATVTTAGPTAITTGTVIKTLMQLSTPSTNMIVPVAWGIDFAGSAIAQGVVVELIETDVAATVTAYVAADITKYTDPNQAASILTLGTANSGFTATAEGSITTTRTADAHIVDPAMNFAWQWPLDQEFKVNVSKFLRVRVTAPAAVNALCWVLWQEN